MTLKELIAEAHTVVPKISCESFKQNSNNYFVIDVREGTEIEETGAIPNAVNIPRGLIEMKLSPSNDSQGLTLILLLWFTAVEAAELLLLAGH